MIAPSTLSISTNDHPSIANPSHQHAPNHSWRARGENDPADVLNVPPADTPPTQRQAFDHVVNNILEIQNGEPLSLVITQGRARRISDLLSLSTENIDSLTYLNDANEEKRLHVFECTILHCLKQFVVMRVKCETIIMHV